jgi:hypothetical protein
MERLANLGDTDSEVVSVLEHELAAWVKQRIDSEHSRGRRRDTVSTILAAADSKTRSAIVANLKSTAAQLASAVKPIRGRSAPMREPRSDEYRIVRSMAKRRQVNGQLRSLMPEYSAGGSQELPQSPPASRLTPLPAVVPRPALPHVEFDHLIHLDARMLARLLAVADPGVLAIALAGSNDELVDRVCDQMPKRIAKTFRRELRRMGPTRLSDVEQAQRTIAEIAAQQIVERRGGSPASANTLSAV